MDVHVKLYDSTEYLTTTPNTSITPTEEQLFVDDNSLTVEGMRMVMEMQNRMKLYTSVAGKDKKLNVHCLYSCEIELCTAGANFSTCDLLIER